MNSLLPQVLAELNLQPGQCRRVQVNGYHLEIRRPIEEKQSDFVDMVMLEPWVALPRPKPVASLLVKPGALPLPVPPEIPPYEEGSEE
jgi:hypothetical protein